LYLRKAFYFKSLRQTTLSLDSH